MGQDHRIINSAIIRKSLLVLVDHDRQRQVWRGEIKNRAKDGVTIGSIPHRSVSQLRRKTLPYVAIRSDITERKLAKSESREAALLDQAQDAILVRDLEQNILFWNKGAERIYGWTAEEAIGRNAAELLLKEPSRQFENARQAVIDKGEWRGDIRQLRRDGAEIIVESRWTLVRDDQGAPTSILVINTDITEKKGMEAQFLRAQRMESIGTLAGGIAHDLNNVLSPILMAIDMLQLKATDEATRKWLEVLRTNAERGGDMVRQVLSFAGA